MPQTQITSNSGYNNLYLVLCIVARRPSRSMSSVCSALASLRRPFEPEASVTCIGVCPYWLGIITFVSILANNKTYLYVIKIF